MGHLFPANLKDIMQATISIVYNTSWYSGKSCDVYVTSSRHLLLTIKATNPPSEIPHSFNFPVSLTSAISHRSYTQAPIPL